MKRIFTLLGLAALLPSGAQAQQEQHDIRPLPAERQAFYSNDIIIENNAPVDQRRVRLSVAFNGWLYAAYTTVDTSNNGGITIRRSKDNGQNWTTFSSYAYPNVRYEAFDLVVAGSDTNNLRLYLAGVNHNSSLSNYTVYIDKYDATTMNYLGNNYAHDNGSRRVYDISIASDYHQPAFNASPYSLGLLYSKYGSSQDSLIFVCSTDGGGSWGPETVVAKSGYYFDNVTLAYGRSNSASNGRYFAAYERLASYQARTGNIYFSRCLSTIDGSWIAPVCLDSINSAMTGVCRNPQIAVQFNNTDNDSGSVTAIVLCERDWTGSGGDYDVLGFYNKRAHFTSYWNRLDISNTGANDMHPDISFDPGYNNFLAVYYDSTNGKLPYVVNGMNLATPNSWITVSAQYNDVTSNLKAAWPRVEINPVELKTAHAWIAENGTNGVAMFDAEYVYTGIGENANGPGGMNIDQLYPNPASGELNIFVSGNQPGAMVTVIDVLGKVVLRENISGDRLQLDVRNWTEGTYFCKIENGREQVTRRFTVLH